VGFNGPEGDSERPFCRHDVSNILLHFPKLNALTFFGVYLQAFCKCPSSLPNPGPFSLQELTVDAGAASGTDLGHFDFLSILSVFDDIKFLRINRWRSPLKYVFGVTETSPQGQLCLRTDALQNLRVHSIETVGWSPIAMDVLNDRPTLHPLDSIIFFPDEKDDLQLMGKSLTTYPHCVRHITFEGWGPKDYLTGLDDDIWQRDDPSVPLTLTAPGELTILGSGLKSCFSLESVKFVIGTQNKDHDFISHHNLRHLMESAAFLITNLPPSTQIIIFDLTLDNAENMSSGLIEKTINWDEIQTAILGLRTTTLEVRFEWQRVDGRVSGDDSGGIRSVIKNNLPILVGRGLLKF